MSCARNIVVIYYFLLGAFINNVCAAEPENENFEERREIKGFMKGQQRYPHLRDYTETVVSEENIEKLNQILVKLESASELILTFNDINYRLSHIISSRGEPLPEGCTFLQVSAEKNSSNEIFRVFRFHGNASIGEPDSTGYVGLHFSSYSP